MTAHTISPPEDELIQILKTLRKENPNLGISKLAGLLLTDYQPQWTVSEKRIRKLMQLHGLMVPTSASTSTSTPDPALTSTSASAFTTTSASASAATAASTSSVKKKKKNSISGPSSSSHPKSRLNTKIDVKKWTQKVAVEYFDDKKGKGLISTEKICKLDIIWKEDPSILAPEWAIYEIQRESRACAHCSTLLQPQGSHHSSLILNCPASTSTTPCPATFCTRLCLTRSATTHPLLCPSQNPASIPFLQFCREKQWMAPHALARFTSKIMFAANQSDDDQLEMVWEEYLAYAMMSMEDRSKMKDPQYPAEPDRESWKMAYTLYLATFRDPPTPYGKKKLSRLIKKPLPEHITDELFSYQGFLRGLGRISLNIEAHGGLYALHSHLNHSCAPNISVRHLDQRTALARISVIALDDIQPGQELLVTYVDPSEPVWKRRLKLKEWGFGRCDCERCLKEQGEEQEAGRGEYSSGGFGIGGDMEKELREKLLL